MRREWKNVLRESIEDYVATLKAASEVAGASFLWPSESESFLKFAPAALHHLPPDRFFCLQNRYAPPDRFWRERVAGKTLLARNYKF